MTYKELQNEYNKRLAYKPSYFLLAVPTAIITGLLHLLLSDILIFSEILYKGLEAAVIYCFFSFFLMFGSGMKYRYSGEPFLSSLLSDVSYPYYLKSIVLVIAAISSIVITIFT